MNAIDDHWRHFREGLCRLPEWRGDELIWFCGLALVLVALLVLPIAVKRT